MVCGSIPRWLSHPASTGYRVAFPGGEEAVAWLWPLTPIWHQGYKKSTHMPLLPICDFMACSMVDFTCTCYPSAVLTWFLYTSLCKSTPPLRQYGNPLPNATLPSAFLTICVWKWLNIRGRIQIAESFKCLRTNLCVSHKSATEAIIISYPNTV